MSDAFTVEGTCGEVELAKRQYLPGVVIKGACPACKAPFERDLGSDYLSYPRTGQPAEVYGGCEKCGHEWELKVIVRLTVEVAPEKEKTP